MNPVGMLRERKIAIPGRYGVERIGVFGSFVRTRKDKPATWPSWLSSAGTEKRLTII